MARQKKHQQKKSNVHVFTGQPYYVRPDLHKDRKPQHNKDRQRRMKRKSTGELVALVKAKTLSSACAMFELSARMDHDQKRVFMALGEAA